MANEALQVAVRAKDRKIEDLVYEIKAMLDDSLDVDSMVDGRFTDDVRKTVMSLHSLGLGINNISDCIRIVAHDLIKVDVKIFPSLLPSKVF